jgi:hypothetical protein
MNLPKINLPKHFWRRLGCAAGTVVIVIGLVGVREQTRATADMSTWEHITMDGLLTAVLIGPGILVALFMKRLGIIWPLRRKRRLHETELEHTKKRSITLLNRRKETEAAHDRLQRLKASYQEAYELEQAKHQPVGAIDLGPAQQSFDQPDENET